MLHHRLLPALLAVILPSMAAAQWTITDGDVSFTRSNSSFDSTPSADLVGASTSLAADQLSEFGWWYRIVGVGTRELPFPLFQSLELSGATSTLVWQAFGGPSGVFEAQEVATVLDPGLPGVGDGGELELTLTIKNRTESVVDVELFAMVDLDLAGSASDDSAQLLVAPRMLALSDGSTDARAQLYGAFAGEYLVRPHGATSVGALLNDTSADDFDSTGLPFGPGNFTGGFQWTLTLQPSESTEVAVVIGIDHSVFCDDGGGRSLYCGDFEVRPAIGWSTIEPAHCSGLCGTAQTAAGCFCDVGCLVMDDCCADACLTCGFCQPF